MTSKLLKFGLVVLFGVTLCAALAYSIFKNEDQPLQEQTTSSETNAGQEITPPPTDHEMVMTRIRQKRDYIEVPMPRSENPGYQIYRNDEWGFQFEHSEEWEVWENSSAGASTLFNVVLQPKENRQLPDGILIDVMPDRWVRAVLENLRADGKEMMSSIMWGYSALSFDLPTRGIKTEITLLPVHPDYWIYLSLAPNFGYDEAYNHMVNTLEFFPGNNE